MTSLKEGKKKEKKKKRKKSTMNSKKKKKSIANIFVKSLAKKGIYVKCFK